jgi:hypothetical protein
MALEPLDDWLFTKAVSDYDVLGMYELPAPAICMLWTSRTEGELLVLSEDQVCARNTNKYILLLQVQLLELPEKVVQGAESLETHDERDLDIVSGGFCEHSPEVAYFLEL